MSFVAAAVAGGAVVSGVAGYEGATQAAKTQASASRDAIQTMEQLNAPFREAGVNAINTLTQEMGPGGNLSKPFNFDITTDPGYNFRLNQGTTAIENSAAAKGMQLSSANLKDLVRFGQDYASGEFMNAFNRDIATKNQRFSELSTVAGIGAGVTTNQSNATSSLLTGSANATASGQVGAANAIGGAAQGVGNAFLLSSILPKSPTVTSPAASGALDIPSV